MAKYKEVSLYFFLLTLLAIGKSGVFLYLIKMWGSVAGIPVLSTWCLGTSNWLRHVEHWARNCGIKCSVKRRSLMQL